MRCALPEFVAPAECVAKPLSEREFTKSLGGKRGGRHWQRKAKGGDGAHLPVFLSAPNLRPYISKELALALMVPIAYLPHGGGGKANGIEASIIPDICNVFLKAREDDGLHVSQTHIAQQAVPSLGELHQRNHRPQVLKQFRASGGRVFSACPVDSATIRAASWFTSRLFLLERFGIWDIMPGGGRSVHPDPRGKDFKLTHYRIFGHDPGSLLAWFVRNEGRPKTVSRSDHSNRTSPRLQISYAKIV